MRNKILLFLSLMSAIFFLNINKYNYANAESIKSHISVKGGSDNNSNVNSKLSIYYDNGIPDSYALMQNYPNPFNPTTVIKYAIPDESHVIIKVFNSLGNEVETLVDQTQAAGYHKIILNGEKLSSGVYYTQLRAGKFVKVIKMILVK